MRARALQAIARTAPELDDTIGFIAVITEQLAPTDQSAWWKPKLGLILDGAERLLDTHSSAGSPPGQHALGGG
ncbi:MAG: hypothetical protein VB036_04420 [Propionicimonas sp.]|nr:hypothetical protein [Propionicimonas sp.]